MLLLDEQILFQLTNGLNYMHSKNIAHRNIHPDHVLFLLNKPAQVKWSGLISSKRTDKSGRCSMTSEYKGTQKYLAPEIIRMMNYKKDGRNRIYNGIRSDIFSAGCVFFYFVTRGVHPFENSDGKIHINILNGNLTKLESMCFKLGINLALSFISSISNRFC